MIKHNAPSRVNAQISDLTIARLDIQDPEQALPIREYLEQNGCAVVVNRKPAIHETYHIICGDVGFVEHTIASMPQCDTQHFVVLFLRSNEKFSKSPGAIRAKIAVVAGSAVSARDTNRIFAYFFTGDEKIFYLENDEIPTVELKPVSPRTLKFWLIAVAIVVAPAVWYLISLSIIIVVQWYGVNALQRGDGSRTAMVARVGTYWVGQGRWSLALIGLPANVLGGAGFIRSQERVLSITQDIVTAQEKILDLLIQSRAMAPILFASGETAINHQTSLSVAIDRMRLSLEDLINVLGLSGAQLRLMAADNQFPFTISFVKGIMRHGEAKIASALTHARALRHLLTLYRAAGGFDEKKTYFMLLQNSMELRPTGGFIGSVATIDVADGVIAAPVVQDVYALDGQLKGHVDPPIPIKELLQQEHWYLRDSNWDPDFAVSAQQAAWFYQKETGRSVDGVIAVSTPVLTDLLGVTGPLDIRDYNDRITKENFFGKSLFYTKADFFPGSTQKKDFLGSLTVAIMSRLISGKPGDVPRLMHVVSNALTRGDIQFWFPEGHVQAITEQAGWAGELRRPIACETYSAPCMVERVAIVESNMGVNKVNSYIRRSVKSRVDLANDGGVDGAISLTYQNTSADDAALSGGGVYLSYTRVYLADDARISSVLIDGEEAPYTDTTQNGSTIVGLEFIVPPGMEKTVTISYRRGIPLVFTNNESTLAVSMRKQPGMTDTTLDAAIGYPAGWSTDAATETFANIREVRYNTTLDQTKTFFVRFSK